MLPAGRVLTEEQWRAGLLTGHAGQLLRVGAPTCGGLLAWGRGAPQFT